MKKIIPLLLCLFMTVDAVSAHSLNGIRVGGSFLKREGDSIPSALNPKNIQERVNNNEVDYHIGLFHRSYFSILYIQPELLVIRDKGEKGSTLSNFKRIDIPVLAGISLFGIRIQTGPVFTLPFEKLNQGKDIQASFKQNGTVGWQNGIGIDIGNIVIDVKYKGTLAKAGFLGVSNDSFSGIRSDEAPETWVVSVGFNIF